MRTKLFKVVDVRRGIISFEDSDGIRYQTGDDKYDVQVGQAFYAEVDSNGFTVTLDSVPDDVLRTNGFEVQVHFASRSKVPRGWREIQGELEGRKQVTESGGIVLVIRTPGQAEAERLYRLINAQVWAGDITEIKLRAYSEVIKWFEFPRHSASNAPCPTTDIALRSFGVVPIPERRTIERSTERLSIEAPAAIASLPGAEAQAVDAEPVEQDSGEEDQEDQRAGDEEVLPSADLLEVLDSLRGTCTLDDLRVALGLPREVVRAAIDRVVAEGVITEDVDGVIRRIGAGE